MRHSGFDIFVPSTFIKLLTFSTLLLLKCDASTSFSTRFFFSLSWLIWLTISVNSILLLCLLSVVAGVLLYICICSSSFYNCLCYWRCFVCRDYFELISLILLGDASITMSAYSTNVLLLCAFADILCYSFVLLLLIPLSWLTPWLPLLLLLFELSVEVWSLLVLLLVN